MPRWGVAGMDGNVRRATEPTARIRDDFVIWIRAEPL
jgi:hypothetical protein